MLKKRSNKTRRRRMWTDHEKEELLREVAQLTSEDKPNKYLLKEKGVGDSWFYTMRRRYLAAHPKFNPDKPSTALALRLEPVDVPASPTPRRKVTVHLANLSNDEIVSMAREYMTLQGKGKSVFLREHGLNHQHIHEIKKRAGLILGTDFRLYAKKPSHEFAQAPMNGAALVPPPVATLVPVSLDDAILAMEVKRDQLSTFIDDLRRMQRGHR